MNDHPDARGPRVRIVIEHDGRTAATGWCYMMEVAPDQRHVRLDLLLDKDFDDWDWSRLPGDVETTARRQEAGETSYPSIIGRDIDVAPLAEPLPPLPLLPYYPST